VVGYHIDEDCDKPLTKKKYKSSNAFSSNKIFTMTSKSFESFPSDLKGSGEGDVFL